MTRNDAFLEKIRAMREDDFSRKIVIPLLTRMGYDFADFHGGPYEFGKDIIAYSKSKFGDIEVTVVQNKKLEGKLKNTNPKFLDIINQIRMCIENTVPCNDGISRKPSLVLFVTPFEIPVRLMTEQFETYKITGVKIVDASNLLELIENYWPEALEMFESKISKAIQISPSELINTELNKALHTNEESNYLEYYSDLNFFVGNTDSRTIISSTIIIKNHHNTTYTEDEWKHLKSINNRILQCIETGIILGDIKEIEESFIKSLDLHFSEVNQKKCLELNRLREKIEGNKIVLKQLTKSVVVDLNTSINREKNKKSQDNCIRESLESILSSATLLMESLLDSIAIKGLIDISVTHQKNDILRKDLNNTFSLIESAARETLKDIDIAAELESTIYPHPNIEAKTNTDISSELFNKKISKIANSLERLNKKELSATETRKLLDEINVLLRCIDYLLTESNKGFIDVELVKYPAHITKLDISAHTLFDSGCNITVYGEAGAGKSTTLHVYANKLLSNRKEDELILFLPLNRITSKINNLSNEKRKSILSAKSNFDKLINSYLEYKDLPSTNEYISSLLSIISGKRKVVIVIDALDEAAQHSSWIISALSEIPVRIKSAQVITSSRSTVKNIKEIEFLGITLLPFNQEQLKKFIFGYLKEDAHKETLWKDIQNNDLFEVAKNPLLATIICTLHKNGVMIPRNEPEVYRRKIELLCGLYDHYKGITRTKNDITILRDSCRIIGYGMHINEKREASIEEIRDYLKRGFEDKVDSSKFDEIIDDLYSKCNVLTYISESKTYTFGHLRIQEYLAAEMLSSKSSIDVISLASKSWWAGALYLYSFNNEIDGIIERIYKRHGTYRHHTKALEVMISAQPLSRRSNLQRLLQHHDRLDRISDDFIEDYEYGDHSADW